MNDFNFMSNLFDDENKYKKELKRSKIHWVTLEGKRNWMAYFPGMEVRTYSEGFARITSVANCQKLKIFGMTGSISPIFVPLGTKPLPCKVYMYSLNLCIHYDDNVENDFWDEDWNKLAEQDTTERAMVVQYYDIQKQIDRWEEMMWQERITRKCL